MDRGKEKRGELEKSRESSLLECRGFGEGEEIAFLQMRETVLQGGPWLL